MTAWSRQDVPYVVAVVLLISVAVGRVVSTYPVFNQTYDEPFHVAGGMEWLQNGTRTWQEQPPMGQVAVALGPYLQGLRLSPGQDLNQQGTAVLYSSGDYWRNLKLARLGTIPFLVLGCTVVFLWGRRWFSRLTGLFALIFFISLPPVLAHAGLATVDMACAATLAAALYQSMRWLEEPRLTQSVRLGIALGIALLCKFSSIGFLAACYMAAGGFLLLTLRRELRRPRMLQAGIALAACFLVLWAGYRFSLTPVSTHVGSHPGIERRFQSQPVLRAIAYRAVECPVPLTDMARGILQVYKHNKSGHDSYLLGRYSNRGWWYFFPVVLAVKTPVAFLLLALAGMFTLAWHSRTCNWQKIATALFATAILLVCVSSKIDLGVRHILPIYPLLALLAGHAVSSAVQARGRRVIGTVAVLLGIWAVADSWIAHPDYLAWFNQFAGPNPDRILAESDLDWGQDLHRLSGRLKALGVEKLSIRYFGTAPLDKAGLPPYELLSSGTQTTGYIAVSVRYLTLEYAKTGAFAWLHGAKPIEKVGKSIYLFYRAP